MIGLDTSFLCSLFVKDANHEEAVYHFRKKEIFIITPLVKLEFRNALNQQILRKTLTTAERNGLWLRFEEMVADGVFIEMSPSTTALYQKARELSDRYTPALATRRLDLLHVAAAVLLKVDAFYTFDDRQRLAAVGEGLSVVP